MFVRLAAMHCLHVCGPACGACACVYLTTYDVLQLSVRTHSQTQAQSQSHSSAANSKTNTTQAKKTVPKQQPASQQSNSAQKRKREGEQDTLIAMCKFLCFAVANLSIVCFLTAEALPAASLAEEVDNDFENISDEDDDFQHQPAPTR